MDIKLEEIAPKEIMAGYHGKMIHTENMTLAFWEVESGSSVPLHSHLHEQIMQVLEGEFEFTVDGKTRIYQFPDIVVIPSNTPHSGKAITKCKLMDIFSPAREEYK